MDAIADIMEAEDKTMDEPRSDKDEFTPVSSSEMSYFGPKWVRLENNGTIWPGICSSIFI